MEGIKDKELGELAKKLSNELGGMIERVSWIADAMESGRWEHGEYENMCAIWEWLQRSKDVADEIDGEYVRDHYKA
jgi:hypothetical protein